MDASLQTIIISTVLSVVASVIVAIIFCGGKRFFQWYSYRKLFKEYKKYAIEFLENCIAGYNNKSFTFCKTTYPLDKLEIEIICLPDNVKLGDLYNNMKLYIPVLSLGFLSVKYMLEYKERWLLRYILDNMYYESKWFRRGICQLKHNNDLVGYINFSEFNIQDKEGVSLSFLDKDCFIQLSKNTDINKLKMILGDLKHNEFDKRIKGAIRQWKQTNSNTL